MTETHAINVVLYLDLVGEWAAPDFHSRVEAFMDQLVIIEEADEELSDSATAGDSGKSEVVVEMLVFTADPLHAIMKVVTAARTAIHALGDSTPQWPGYEEIIAALGSARIETQQALVPA